jgi:hypothetical protein
MNVLDMIGIPVIDEGSAIFGRKVFGGTLCPMHSKSFLAEQMAWIKYR